MREGEKGERRKKNVLSENVYSRIKIQRASSRKVRGPITYNILAWN